MKALSLTLHNSSFLVAFSAPLRQLLHSAALCIEELDV